MIQYTTEATDVDVKQSNNKYKRKHKLIVLEWDR